MTTPERWQEIDRIFAAALELEPAERAGFLVEACGGDDELRKEVESLLSHDSPESLAGSSAVDEATRILSESEAPAIENRAIGPYKIIRRLGAGGMGQIYLGHDSRLNRSVAVKLLSFYAAAESERVRRFRQEALAASALNHPNILTIHEIGEFEGHNYLVSEFVEGQTLHRRIQQRGIATEEAVDIAIQVASALSAAHAAGIVHRDIKPENIMLRPDGLVKVLDFGIAKYIKAVNIPQQETLLKTTPGEIIGTAAYMSPEQARGIRVDPRTDIWSLGVVLFEMVAGRRPFVGETSLDVLSAVIEREPPSFSALGIAVPELFQRIVNNALQKPVDARYQNANELLGDLKSLRKSLELGVPVERATPLDSKSTAVGAGLGNDPVSAATAGDTYRDKTGVLPKAEPTNQRASRIARTIVVAVSVLLLLGVAAFAYWFYPRGSFEPKSIAVLPFKNETGNRDLEYLSDGMTDSLINSLSQLPQVMVKARNSSFRYKNVDIDPERVASELSVEAVLNGRMVQRGDDLTLYLSLVDGRNGNQVWGEQYDRKVSDLLSLQREIARDVSEKLRFKLTGTAGQRVTKDYTANEEAYRLYLRGRFHLYKLIAPEAKEGIAYFQKAIDLDPNYALAYVGLSEANRSLALGSEMPPREYFARSKAAAHKALQFDEELAEAHTALGANFFWFDRNWIEAENQYRRALELNPNSADTHVFYAHLLSNIGRHNEAIAEIGRAKDIDPLSPFISSLAGQFLLHAGKPDEALATLTDTLKMAPGFWFPHLFASSAYIEKGMFAEAVTEARRASELSPYQTMSNVFEGYALAKMGKRDEARAVLDKLLALSQQRFIPPYNIALLSNALGDREQTFIWLERGIEAGDPKLTFLKVEPKWNNLRDDAKFQEIIRRVGF